MPKPDLSTLTLKQLEELRSEVDVAIEERREQETAELAEQLRKDAEARGISPDAVARALGAGGSRKKRGASKPKYRNTENPDQIWTGKGKRPKWLVEALAQGKKLDHFLIGQT